MVRDSPWRFMIVLIGILCCVPDIPVGCMCSYEDGAGFDSRKDEEKARVTEVAFSNLVKSLLTRWNAKKSMT